MNFAYQQSALGGTFDHFHLGHQKLIGTAFEQSEHVTIGLTTAQMYKKKYLTEAIEDYQTRRNQLEDYLYQKGVIERATVVPITDIYGPTLNDTNIQAIFATEENASNVDLINTKRIENGLHKLEVIIVSYIKADDGRIISSERIRKGEIDREGFVYQSLFDHKQTLIMPEALRDELHAPLGDVVKTTQEVLSRVENKMVISVGDIISEEMKKSGMQPAVNIIDFRTRRHALPHISFENAVHAVNQHGTINQQAVEIFLAALNTYFATNQSQTIIIDGEEDLLALPAILLAPLGSFVLYGQYGQGIVVNKVTDDLKKRIMQLVYAFD